MASKRHQRRRACLAKQFHATAEQANAHVYALLKSTGRRVGVYKCSFCAGFHVGRRPQPPLEVRRQKGVRGVS